MIAVNNKRKGAYDNKLSHIIQTNRMKILCVIPSLTKGGAERVLSVLSKEWIKDHDVIIVTFNNKKKSYSIGGREIPLRIPAKKNSVLKLYNIILRMMKLVNIIRTEKPDKIISFMETANIPTLFASFLTRNLSKHIVSIHNNPKSFPLIYRISIKYLYRYTKKIVTVSNGIMNELLSNKYNLPSNKIISIPNPIDFEEIQKLKTQKELELWDSNIPTFIAMGRLHPQKGFDNLIKAFYIVNKTIESQLVILGEGDERTELEKIAGDLNITDKIIMPGVVENPFYYLNKADVFVLSSRYEGWGNVIVEALASSVPIISFDCNYGPAEILGDSYGKLVEHGNINNLAETMIELIKDHKSCEEFIHRGLQRAKIFDSKNIANRWLI